MSFKPLIAAALALAGTLAAGAAQAERVNWSIGINAPLGDGVSVGTVLSNTRPVVVQPAPLYYPAPRVVYAPAPVYYGPPPPRVVYAPAPIYVQPAPVAYRPWGWREGRRWHHQHDHDRD